MPRPVLHGLLIVLAFWVAAHATLVTRPTKTCGTTNFSSEVTAGCTTIKASEVDGDLNAIVGGLNDITTANIDPAGLGTAAYADGSVSTSKLADQAVTTAKIADQAVTSAKLGTVGFQSVAVSVGHSTVGSGETTFVTLPNITTNGGRVLLTGLGGLVITDGSASGGNVTVKVKRGGTALTGGTFTFSFGPTTSNVYSALPFPSFVDSPAAGTYAYTVTVQVPSGFAADTVAPTGTYFAMELH